MKSVLHFFFHISLVELAALYNCRELGALGKTDIHIMSSESMEGEVTEEPRAPSPRIPIKKEWKQRRRTEPGLSHKHRGDRNFNCMEKGTFCC